MQPMYYIGLDVHKQKISYCVKDSSGKIYAEGWIPASEIARASRHWRLLGSLAVRLTRLIRNEEAEDSNSSWSADVT